MVFDPMELLISGHFFNASIRKLDIVKEWRFVSLKPEFLGFSVFLLFLWAFVRLMRYLLINICIHLSRIMLTCIFFLLIFIKGKAKYWKDRLRLKFFNLTKAIHRKRKFYSSEVKILFFDWFFLLICKISWK